MGRNLFMKKIKIGNKIIGDHKPVFIIAEAGVNHNGSLKNGKKLIDIAVKAKADAVKFQSFIADNIIIPKGPKAKYHIETTGSNKEQSWYDLLKSQEMSLRMHSELIKYCKRKKIIFLSTPYDEESAEILNKFNIAAFKIASTDNDNYPFLKFLTKFKKPIIISTAMSNLQDVKDAYKVMNRYNNNGFAFLQCTGNYPSKVSDSNINVIKTYKKILNCPVGYSDHTQNNTSAILSVAHGAKIIEKHFTINKKMYGPDHRMSLSPSELINFVNSIREAEKALGQNKKIILTSEVLNKSKLKKSLVAGQLIKAGQLITKNMIKIKRPATGIRPKYLSIVVGKKAKKDIRENQILKKNMIR